MFGSRTAVPEATIHENGHPLATKYEVRLAKQPLAPAPTANPRSFEKSNHPQLGVTITATPNARHYF
jgi:hypothetical protein